MSSFTDTAATVTVTAITYTTTAATNNNFNNGAAASASLNDFRYLLFIPIIFIVIVINSPLQVGYVVGSKSFRPDTQKPRQMENAVRDV